MPKHLPVNNPNGGRPVVALTDEELQQVEKLAFQPLKHGSSFLSF